MQRGGDQIAGYSVEYDAARAVLRVVGWGFWSIDVARGFDQAVISEYRRAATRNAVLFDLSGLKPMRDEGQTAFTTALSMLKVLGLERLSVLTASHLVKLQVLRLVLASGLRDKVTFL